MSQSFIKQPAQGSHSALAGLGVLSTERAPADPLDVLRRIVAWRDDVHAGNVVRSADLEALIEEGRRALGVPACRALQPIPSEWSCDCVEPGPGCRPTGIRRPHGVPVPVSQTKTPSGTDGGPHG